MALSKEDFDALAHQEQIEQNAFHAQVADSNRIENERRQSATVVAAAKSRELANHPGSSLISNPGLGQCLLYVIQQMADRMGHQHLPRDPHVLRQHLVDTWLEDSLRIMGIMHGLNTPAFNQKKAELEAEAVECRRSGVFLGESGVIGAPSFVRAAALVTMADIELTNVLILGEDSHSRETVKFDVGAGITQKILFTKDVMGQMEGRATEPDHFEFISHCATTESEEAHISEVKCRSLRTDSCVILIVSSRF